MAFAGSLRIRLALTLVTLVAVTVAAIGIGVYGFVDVSLRARLLADARRQADFNLSVLLPAEAPAPTNAVMFAAGGLPAAFRFRGDVETIADFGGGDAYVSTDRLQGALGEVDPRLRAIVASGELGYSWQDLRGRPVLIVGGRQGGPPAIYLVFDAGTLEEALLQLRLGLAIAGLLAVFVALATAGAIARGILRPVAAAGAAAREIAAGNLAARVPPGGRDELGRLAAELNRMAGSLEATVEGLESARRQNRRFVADVTHELRTPLTALVAEASLIEGSLAGLDPDARRAAELLVADVRRLRTLVDDLLEISRFDAASEVPVAAPVDLGRVVTGVVTTRLPEAAVSIPRAPVVVDTDPRRIDRILGNLLDNARDHAAGAPVEVALALTRDGACVIVADRGPGVPADALPRLFERFFKADPSRHGGSSGLGLAIAAEHAALLGATLRARASTSGGLIFVLTLPVTRSLPPGDAADTDHEQDGARSEPLPRIEP
jgi:two-component system sensor histidine kinase MtrB